MTAGEPNQELTLKVAFQTILSSDFDNDYIIDLVQSITNFGIDQSQFSSILHEHGISSPNDIKEELLELILMYVNIALNDHLLSEDERANVKQLKRLFKVKEGEFYDLCYDLVEDTLSREFFRIYLDDKVDVEEALHMVSLQELFDLSYDQFEDRRSASIRAALSRGADILSLDTSRSPSLFELQYVMTRNISQKVKDLVWNRDNGTCVNCGSNERLEFDHIIPFSKGGSNTYRNLQLLCEPCNRRKYNKVG